jgi:hypothetical protein
MPTRVPCNETQLHTSHRPTHITHQNMSNIPTHETITTTTTPTHTDTHPTPPTTPTPTQQLAAGYTHLPLPMLQPTDIRVLSHNINTLPTTSVAELGASLDLYSNLTPTILGMQEMNKNWKCYDATVGRLRHCMEW